MSRTDFDFYTIPPEHTPSLIFQEEYWRDVIFADKNNKYWHEQSGFVIVATDKDFEYSLTVSRTINPFKFSLSYCKTIRNSFKSEITVITTSNTGDMNEFLVLPNLIALPKRSFINPDMALSCILEFTSNPDSLPNSVSWFDDRYLDYPEDL